MTSPVDVVNLALTQMGSRTFVSSINPSDGSNEGNVASIIYQPKLDALFRAAPWAFARKQVFLTQLKAAVINGVVSTSPPPQPWLFEYEYPSDCIKLRYLLPNAPISGLQVPLQTASTPLWGNQVYGANAAIKFQIATDTDANGVARKVILCNLPEAQAIYTFRVDNPDLWDTSFYNAAAATLTVWFIAGLARDRGQFQDFIRIAMDIINKARTDDGNESITTMDHLPDWIMARGLGSVEDSALSFYGWEQIAWPNGSLL